MSDSPMDMREKSPYTATFKVNGGFSGSPLRNDYFVAGARLAAKGSFRQCEIRGQKFCRRGGLPPARFTVAAWSNRLPGKFPPMTSNHPSTAFRDQGHCHDFLIVRIYYREKRFIEGFAVISTVHFCVAATQRSRTFLSDSSMDMKQKSQHTAETRRMAL
jgi:hypothetical protein